MWLIPPSYIMTKGATAIYFFSHLFFARLLVLPKEIATTCFINHCFWFFHCSEQAFFFSIGGLIWRLHYDPEKPSRFQTIIDTIWALSCHNLIFSLEWNSLSRRACCCCCCCVFETSFRGIFWTVRVTFGKNCNDNFWWLWWNATFAFTILPDFRQFHGRPGSFWYLGLLLSF